MKKILLTLLTICLVLPLVSGCTDSGTTQETSETSEAAVERTSVADAELPDISAYDISEITIGFLMSNGSSDSYMTAYYNHLPVFAEEMGFNLIAMDAVGDVTKQTIQVQDMITLAPDVIVLWPMNSETAVTYVKAINESGIPCITANTNVVSSGEDYIEGFVGPSNVEEAYQTALQMIEDIGTEGNVFYISDKIGYSTTNERKQGFDNAIADTDIVLVDEQADEASRDKAQQIMENWLVTYGEGEIDAVFCMDDNGAIGAYNAVVAANRVGEFPIYCAATGDSGTLTYIENGYICGTAVQSPYIDSESALTYAVWIALGNELPAFYCYIETPIATPENLATIGAEELLP